LEENSESIVNNRLNKYCYNLRISKLKLNCENNESCWLTIEIRFVNVWVLKGNCEKCMNCDAEMLWNIVYSDME
jgi:hypothetical protein